MTDLTLDDWRALVARLGERSPDRRALAAAELERLATASARAWAPLTPERLAPELGRVFGPAASAHQRERSAIIAEQLASDDPIERSTAAIAQALGLSEPRARVLIAEHKRAIEQAAKQSGAQALKRQAAKRAAVSAR